MVVFLFLFILGNIVSVSKIIDMLFCVGVEVIYGVLNDIYISGYGG